LFYYKKKNIWQIIYISASVRDFYKFIFSQTFLIPHRHTNMDEKWCWCKFDSRVVFQMNMSITRLDADKRCHKGTQVVICFAIIPTHDFELNKSQFWIHHFEFYSLFPNRVKSILKFESFIGVVSVVFKS